MRAVLAVRRHRVNRSGVGGAVRALPGRPCRMNHMTESGHDVMIPSEGVHDDESTSAGASVGTRWLEVWLPILIVVVDQITKALVRTRVPLYASITIFPGFLNLTHVLN